MARPMQMYTYIHDGIMRDVAHFEDVARELNRDDPEAIATFGEAVATFHRRVKVHEHTEEAVLFPALNERFQYVAETYAFDHEDFEPNVFDALNAAVRGLTAAEGDGARKDGALVVYRQAVALNEHMRLHIEKENELLIPHLESEFDVAEQAGIAGAMAGQVEPPMMAELVGWLYDGMTSEDREGMVRFLMMILPAEPLGKVTGMLAAKGDAEWADVRRRIPELDAG